MQSLQGRLFALLSAWLVNGLVSLLVLANVINLDADLVPWAPRRP
jgi:hypothetical protein